VVSGDRAFDSGNLRAHNEEPPVNVGVGQARLKTELADLHEAWPASTTQPGHLGGGPRRAVRAQFPAVKLLEADVLFRPGG